MPLMGLSRCAATVSSGIIEYPAVIIALAETQRFEIGLDIATHELGFCKVHGSAGHGSQLAGGSKAVVGRQPARCGYAQIVFKTICLFHTVKVEVGMVGEVDGSCAVSCSLVVNGKGIIFAPCICHGHIEIAGIAFVSGGRLQCETNGIVSSNFCVPYLVLETCGATVQVVGAVVAGKLIVNSVKGEFAQSDAVGEASGSLAQAGAVLKVVSSRIFLYSRVTLCILPSLSGTMMARIPAPTLESFTLAPEALVSSTTVTSPRGD